MCDAVESRRDIAHSGRLAELQSKINFDNSDTAPQPNVKLQHVRRRHCINTPDETKEIQTLMRQQSRLWKTML